MKTGCSAGFAYHPAKCLQRRTVSGDCIIKPPQTIFHKWSPTVLGFHSCSFCGWGDFHPKWACKWKPPPRRASTAITLCSISLPRAEGHSNSSTSGGFFLRFAFGSGSSFTDISKMVLSPTVTGLEFGIQVPVGCC